MKNIKIKLRPGLVFGILIFLTSPVFAQVYEGIIADIFNGGQSIKVTQVNALTKEKKTILVSIDTKTQISGIDSVSELKTGDAISIDAVEAGFNHLSAKSISVMAHR